MSGWHGHSSSWSQWQGDQKWDGRGGEGGAGRARGRGRAETKEKAAERKRVKENQRKRALPGQQGRNEKSKRLVNDIKEERRRSEMLSLQVAAAVVGKQTAEAGWIVFQGV